MDTLAVELVNVSKRFDEFVAVRDVSLRIGQAEFFSLLGPSGCGKTTTLRMLAGFELPTTGTIRLLGQDIQGQPPHRRNVNMVFQNYALFPHLAVFDNVAFGLQVKRVPARDIQRRVTEALAMVRLPGLERRKPAQLSGGQQQRVALARALVNHPAVLLLDEPLGALDQKLRKEMQLELRRLQREVGITFIYVTHDQEEALTMSDRIAVMSGGQVMQVGPPTEIYEEPNSRFVADFIGESNFISGRVISVNGRQAEFEADGLRIIAEVVPGVKPGAPATLAVRPERIRLTREKPDDTPNAFQGEMSESIYIGFDTRYRIRLTPTMSLQVRQQNTVPVGMSILEGPTGMNVWASWRSENARVLLA